MQPKRMEIVCGRLATHLKLYTLTSPLYVGMKVERNQLERPLNLKAFQNCTLSAVSICIHVHPLNWCVPPEVLDPVF